MNYPYFRVMSAATCATTNHFAPWCNSAIKTSPSYVEYYSQPIVHKYIKCAYCTTAYREYERCPSCGAPRQTIN